MLLFLFIIAIIPAIFVGNKIFKRDDISFIDIYILGCTLYYLLIPYYTYYFTSIDKLNLEECIISISLIAFYLYILLLVSICTRRISILNMTKLFQRLNRQVTIPYNFVYVSIFISSLLLYKVTDYSVLNADNAEANNQLYFGSDMPLGLRIIWQFALQFRPILFLLTLKLLTYNFAKKKKIIIYFSLAITTLSYLLGPKTLMTTAFLFCGIGYYSIYKSQISKQKIYAAIGIVVVLFMVVFPLSQAFRLTKQYVTSNTKASFTTVLDKYINMNEREKKILEERSEKYIKGRSTNVFDCYHSSCTHPFQGNGLLTLFVLKSILPLKQSDLNINGNILGDTYASKGVDIGESVLAWFNADVRYWGLILSILFMFVFYYSYYFYYKVFAKAFKSPLLYLTFIYLAFDLSFAIERNPSGFFHSFYVDYLIGAILFGIIIRILSKSSLRQHYKYR